MSAPPKGRSTSKSTPTVAGRRPWLDVRVRWKAGQVALALAAAMAIVALWRPFEHGTPRSRALSLAALAVGVAGSALLASLRGRGMAAPLAFYVFLMLCVDALGQMLSLQGWPSWPLPALIVASITVAEELSLAFGMAGLAALFAIAEAAQGGFHAWKPAVAASLGYAALVLAINRALVGEKRRLSATLTELARLRHGIDHLDEDTESLDQLSPEALGLRRIAGAERRSRQIDRAAELDEALMKLVRLARMALPAHAVAYFDVDRAHDRAYLRAADGPPALLREVSAPLSADPFSFVLERRQSFYATDFQRLLWSLPYYRGEVKIGSLLAMPVRTADVVAGVLVADRLEIQSFSGQEPTLLEGFADAAAEVVVRARTALTREELGAELKVVYPLSQQLASLSGEPHVRRLLLESARGLVPLEAAAIVMIDDSQTRYVIEEGEGWVHEFQGREVAIDEKTWAAWILRSAQDSYLLDDLAQEQRMPVFVLDEGGGRATSLLAVLLRVNDRTIGALVLTGPRGAFDAAAQRVLGIIANQAAGTLFTIQLKDREKTRAAHDGLTRLYNRRAFDESLVRTIAREERQGRHFALLLMDIDHFKKLNDTFGHAAGDAALRNTAGELIRCLRRGDQAARYGGEEFAAILPDADVSGALQLAERVRQGIQRAQVFYQDARLAVTVSVGVAVWPQHGRDAESLVAAADAALYDAKEQGRNRVVVADLPAEPLEPA